MPLIPNALEKLLIFTLNQVPGPVLDIWNAAAFRFTLAALRLGVFDVLSQGPRSASALAQEIGCDQIYAYADVARWLAAAGFKNVRRINLLQAPGQSLLVGTVP